MTLAVLLCAFTLGAAAQVRKSVNLKHWEFSRDSLSWQSVTIPHDWAISGPFDKKWDLQTVAIKQNGETKATEKSGRSGALPWIGQGWYRTTVSLPAGEAGRQAFRELVFDGAMAEPTVYVNGRKAGYWAYGYNTFRIACEPSMLREGDNEILVHLQNVRESSRWYPGAGLYRPVPLVTVDGRERLDEWSVFFKTDSISGKTAFLSVQAQVKELGGKPLADSTLAVEFLLMNPRGDVAYAAHAAPDAEGRASVDMRLGGARLWSPEHPNRYRLVTRLYKQNRLADEVSQMVGIRTLSLSKEHGFQLNGATRRFKGVCLHHDLGPLGAAVNKAALIRQVKLLKDMGADAIRTSHNMPSQMQMEVYDSLGMMVMAESFDMWIYAKCKNGYARFFKDWAEKDIANLVRAHRNHPSLVMWSIGNEIPDQTMTRGLEWSKRLQDLCHRLDPTRPVTQGLDRVAGALKSGVAQAMDVPGFNYRVQLYPMAIKQLPQGFLLGSETASTVSSRGVYKFPVVWSNSKTYPDGQVSGYDTQWCSWSNLPEEDFIAEDDAPYYIGQFVWTGFDYLGEPTPYDEYWPSRSSYFGMVDLAGLPKDRFYLYRSKWNRKDHTLHLLPHWTWPGREGQLTPVFCYTDYPEAELFVNGKSQGRRRKALQKGDGAIYTGKPATPDEARRRAARYRLMWDDVKYEPGELKVVAYDAQGREAQTTTVRTAGKAAAVKMVADKDVLKADGDDLAYITLSLVDENGVELPQASDEMAVEVKGAATFKALCNGDATSLEVFTEPHMKLFSGKLVITVQAKEEAGEAVVTVRNVKNKKLGGELRIKVE